MTMSAICIVNGISDQKPPPKSCVSCAGPRPSSRPATNTTTIPTRAKTNASGNQRSVQSEIAIPTRIAAGSRGPGTTDVSTLGADPRGLEHGRVRRGRRLDLRGTDAFPRHLQCVVAAAVDVPESIIVDPRPVAVDPDVREASPVRR